MADSGDRAQYSVTCPHCGKAFTAPAFVDETGRQRGFKCPHCRLFVPFERTEATPTGPQTQSRRA
ncbi:MAG: transposase [Actinomycetota bacterium]|nr:transposase [Actinomycetota bacterium]